MKSFALVLVGLALLSSSAFAGGGDQDYRNHVRVRLAVKNQDGYVKNVGGHGKAMVIETPSGKFYLEASDQRFEPSFQIRREESYYVSSWTLTGSMQNEALALMIADACGKHCQAKNADIAAVIGKLHQDARSMYSLDTVHFYSFHGDSYGEVEDETDITEEFAIAGGNTLLVTLNFSRRW